MGLEVYWLELAENKLEDIFGYHLVKANKKVAEKLVHGIVDTTIGIENQPEIGQIEINLNHRKQEFRYLVFKNYKIIYWVNYKYNRIEIANVFDTRQNPKKINETQ
ncbi:type II toxin-antitoxin system RelE/ParE family toxin [Tamlana sp. 2_MG-2023]|uniref:type II toxin-antitoxin system RelE/ParE family toxin n=1 Tax=unclassified Tamlana TaxID=2614803 RepID=UPI0026E32E9D|nr:MULTISPECIES: type II toxin-antitoxin system RelE/ParE family toxin [unclassified Tamlana]MDO6759626.1 type II toxin-antitoxin system RelE/ParE family toxin [Tamlana sp. 2_MG-2023]MDO6791249.1 type II toxin-antitoxin system RelE/ParE family toxin [Tamlana sp. 1_MG-2023]